jgi:hypothetical protein
MEGAADEAVPIVCPDCRDLVSADLDLADVRAGDTIRVFCSRCERTVEVAAPHGIEAFQASADVVVPTVTEFATNGSA